MQIQDKAIKGDQMKYRCKCKLGSTHNRAQCGHQTIEYTFTEKNTNEGHTGKTSEEIAPYCDEPYNFCDLQEKEEIASKDQQELDSFQEIEQLKKANKILSDRLNGISYSPYIDSPMYIVSTDHTNTVQNDWNGYTYV